MEDLPVYSVGDSDLVVIVYYDVFGLTNTRVRELCDIIAQQCNYRVLCPDFYRGTGWPKGNFSIKDVDPYSSPDFKAYLGKYTKSHLFKDYQLIDSHL